jgi:primosomal protein N''
MITIDAKIHEYINEHLDEKLPQIVSERLKQIQPLPVWMTETQLAEYWQLRNKEGGLTVHSIRTWTARPKDEHPLPCGNMGEMRRYHREECDRWAREEAELQRAKNMRKGRQLRAVE